jgi:uncharacterized protein with ATP-grasp and redox domains
MLKKADESFCKYVGKEEERLEFLKQVLKEIYSSNDQVTAPYLNSRINKILKEKIDIQDLYQEEKKKYNSKILLLENDILDIINRSQDKLVSALQYALVGNLIDFGALDTVDDNVLEELIDTAAQQRIDSELYQRFKDELRHGKRLCYITDNAGEIVFDKMFIHMIKEYNRSIELKIIVRGMPVLNDATREDAVEVGIHKYGEIIPNGTAIPGTDLKEVNSETNLALDHSDMIIAKGQGNFETLWGCGKNIYYLFLCKCDLFVRRFSAQKYQGMFVKEQG